MSNLSTKIVLIFLFLRFSSSLYCYECNQGLAEFMPSFKTIVDVLKESIDEEFLENMDSDMVDTLCLQLFL